MMRRPHTLFAAITFIALGAATPAAAGCGGCQRAHVHPGHVYPGHVHAGHVHPGHVHPGPPAVPVFEAPVEETEIYIVNQGPVYSGPGAFRYQPPYVDRLAPRDYPYIGEYRHRPRYLIRRPLSSRG